MAKVVNGEIFEQDDSVRYGDTKRRQNLFIPRLLHQATFRDFNRDSTYKQAFDIVRKWAELDLAGKLSRKKESTLEQDFVTEVFQKALGYTPLSANEAEWFLEAKYAVNGGIADAVLGRFNHDGLQRPTVAIELKGPKTDLDKDRSAGRTAVRQCWDYMTTLEGCEWGIVSNIVSFRLYHRSHSQNTYQLFVLRELISEQRFAEFYYLFQLNGLISIAGKQPRAHDLLAQTQERQESVGDELYELYDRRRRDLVIAIQKPPHSKPRLEAVRIAQHLLDRIIFIAFCEDRHLLPEKIINLTNTQYSRLSDHDNPRWHNFKLLFSSIDKGKPKQDIPAFNGGLFRSSEVDQLDLDDSWADFFGRIGDFDFRDEVNVEVLGHLFEKSVKDIEEIKLVGPLGVPARDDTPGKMSKSAERKRYGIYYTPPEFTQFIVRQTILPVYRERTEIIAQNMGVNPSEAATAERNQRFGAFAQACLQGLRSIKIVDPACGSGAFLIAAYDLLADLYGDLIDAIGYHSDQSIDALREQVPDCILHDNLHGADLSAEAVEISQLALWLRSAQPGKTLADLSRNIVCGNSLVRDPNVDPAAVIWEERFKGVFDRPNGGFDCVIGNPPWERMKLQEREFFSSAAPAIGAAVDAATRRRLISELESSDPELHERYLQAKAEADRNLEYARESGQFPLTGKGDINTYAVFAELARNIVAPRGRVGLLVPSGIATDNTTKDFFAQLVEASSLAAFYDFENKAPVFPDVHRSFKFCVLLFAGNAVRLPKADFVFFARSIKELNDSIGHLNLTASEIKMLNPNTLTCPIFRTRRDAEITKAIYRRVPILIDQNRKESGNPWGIRFLRMFDQTNDAELFHTADQLKEMGLKLVGNHWVKGKKVFLPLYEAKMIQMYDHRAASVIVDEANWMRQGQTVASNEAQHANPEFVAMPRWWVDANSLDEIDHLRDESWFLAYKDVTSPTNTRTMIAAFIPLSGVANSAPLMIADQSVALRQRCCLLGNLNALSLDYVARQKVGGVHLNFFIVEQLPIFAPDFYSQPCPWSRRTKLEKWVSDRVLKLSCTANDMIPLAQAAGFEPPVHKWSERERQELMAELDAAYFILYEIERDDVEYILSTFQGVGAEEDMFGSRGIAARVLDHYDRLRKATE